MYSVRYFIGSLARRCITYAGAYIRADEPNVRKHSIRYVISRLARQCIPVCRSIHQRADEPRSLPQVLTSREFLYHLHVRPQLASWRVSGAGGWPQRLLCGRTVL